MRTLETQFNFAGFAWPRYLADMAIGINAMKKKRETRNICVGYYHAPKPTANHGRGFYLDDAGQPFSRWVWADEVVDSGIRHTGWFGDDFGAGDKVRGIVARISHGRYLAGWSLGEGMASGIEPTIYDSAQDAARMADELAREVAENMREDDEQSEDSF